VGPTGIPPLAVWDRSNSTVNRKSVRDVVTGSYHWGEVNAQLSTALTFNASTWNIPQSIEIRAVDDNVAEGARILQLTHVSASLDYEATVFTQTVSAHDFTQVAETLPGVLQYNQLRQFHTVRDKADDTLTTKTPDVNATKPLWPFAVEKLWSSPNGTIEVEVAEDDLPGITLSSSAVTVTEGLASANYTIVLDSQPKADVTVTSLMMDSYGAGQVTLRPSAMYFTPATWNVPQIVVAEAVNDTDFEGERSFTDLYTNLIRQPFTQKIKHTYRSSDSDYEMQPSMNLLGANEPDQDLLYRREQGVRTTIIDDDGGCLAEYECRTNSSVTGTCIKKGRNKGKCKCEPGYGMRDCSRKCFLGQACLFRRLKLIVECHGGALCGLKCNTPEGDAVDIKRDCVADFNAGGFVKSLHAALKDENENLTLSEPKTSLYIVNDTDINCLFSMAGICRSILLDIDDATDEASNLILSLERQGILKTHPLYIQFSGPISVQALSETPTKIAWGIIGSVLFIFVVVWFIVIFRLCRQTAKDIREVSKIMSVAMIEKFRSKRK